MEPHEPITSEPYDIEAKYRAVAHHEAGHMVIAAAVGLPLKSAGFSIDLGGEGMASYCCQPEETDISRERVLLATFAGWYAQQRFCDLRGLACPDFAHPGMTTDWWGAADILGKLAGREYFAVKEQLEQRSRALVDEHWQVIEFLANALLAKEWEPVKLFESGWKWAKDTTAKYVTGEEAVLILAECGILARCVSEC